MNLRIEVTPHERLILTLLCLPPRQRQLLDVLSLSSGPVACVPLARTVERSQPAVHRELMVLWAASLIRRLGGHPPSYVLAPGMADLVRTVPCRIVRRPGWGGPTPDPKKGALVLEAARSLVMTGEWPSCRQVATIIGSNYRISWVWSGLLKAAGLWPSTDHLDPLLAQTVGLRAAQVRASRINRPIPISKRSKDFVPRVHTVSRSK